VRPYRTPIATGATRARRRGRSALLLLAVFGWAGCTTVDTALPPITETPTGEHRIGKFVWFDLLTEDPATARVFYQRLFDWSFDDSAGPAGYFTIRHEGVAIGGLAQIEDTLSAPEAIWLASISVEDVDATASAAEAFYGDLVGYEVRTVELGEGLVYTVVGRDGHARAGIVEVDWKNVEANWLPYVGVADLNATIGTAYSLGGRLLLRTGDIAILTDPTGGAFGVQQLAGGMK
jgi:predicted enzyme related to lactoylglutathione lyase